jgi:2-keto-3-deoxy-L-rhamnonate aldolase RhmA
VRADDAFALMLMTSDPGIAAEAIRAGVDRIFVDLEITGKADRQRGRSTIISGHTLADVRAVRGVVPPGRLLVRIDPPGPRLAAQVDEVIDAGADIVMLPYFTSAEEVRAFVAAVRGRAVTLLLVETAAAVTRIEPILAVPGVDEVHIGLNDLHRSLGLTFMYEVLASGLIDLVAERVRSSERTVRFGFGGGALLDAKHPVAPADVLLEHARVGSTMIILSRTFTGDAPDVATLRQRVDLQREVARIREVVAGARSRTPDEAERDRRRIHAAIWTAAAALRAG